MSIDYDTRRTPRADDPPLEELTDLAHPLGLQTGTTDVEEFDAVEPFVLPGADLSGEELLVRIVPQQADEFVCSSCFLVHHRHRLSSAPHTSPVCQDCAE